MKKILIDPGHGGNDRANIGHSKKYVEADGNLEFSLALRDYLSPYFEVGMTRETDKTVDLNNRGLMAKGYDMCISIHSDAYSTPTVGGTTVYVSNYLDNNALARDIGLTLANTLGIAHRGVKTRLSVSNDDYYAMIRIPYQLKVPYVLLVERAFHSNPTEERKLLNKELTNKSAKAMADVIIKYFKVGDRKMKIKFKDKTTEIDALFVPEENRNYVKINGSYISIADIIRSLGLEFNYVQEENRVDII